MHGFEPVHHVGSALLSLDPIVALVAESVQTHLVSAAHNLAADLGMSGELLGHEKERAACRGGVHRVENRHCRIVVRTVVEGEDRVAGGRDALDAGMALPPPGAIGMPVVQSLPRGAGKQGPQLVCVPKWGHVR